MQWLEAAGSRQVVQLMEAAGCRQGVQWLDVVGSRQEVQWLEATVEVQEVHWLGTTGQMCQQKAVGTVVQLADAAAEEPVGETATQEEEKVRQLPWEAVPGLCVVTARLSVCAVPIVGRCHHCWGEGIPLMWDYDLATGERVG